MREVVRHGSNIKDQTCEFCGDEAAEHSVMIREDDEDEDLARDPRPLDLCGTCLLHAEFQARDPEGHFDHAARSSEWEREEGVPDWDAIDFDSPEGV